MTFAGAVISVLRNYATFSGRARRSEFWWFFLFTALVRIATGIVDVAANTVVVDGVVVLALLLPGLAVGVRRLHDTNRRGWWILISAIPVVGFIWLLIVACQDSDPGRNRFGDSPKYPADPRWPGAHDLHSPRRNDAAGPAMSAIRPQPQAHPRSQPWPRAGKAMPWPLALVPAVSLGFLAAAPFVYLAVRRPARKCTVAAIVYSIACIAEWTIAVIDFPEDSVGDNIGATLFIALMVIGTAHAFVWRETLAPRAVGEARPQAAAVYPARVEDSSAQTCAWLQQVMAWLDSLVARQHDFPPACRVLLAETLAPISQVLAFGAGGGDVQAQLRTAEAILTDYLPTSLNTYGRLPTQFANTHRDRNGHTPNQELEIQLRLIRDTAIELATSLYEAQSLRLTQHSAFLQDKFGRSELDLP